MKTIKQLTEENISRLKDLELLLDYEFADPSLQQLALVHSSYGFENIQGSRNNETLEFLGDAVLDLAVSELLFKAYPEITEGELTKMRSGLVKEATLAELALAVNLGSYLMLGRGEETSKGREKTSILARAFEALMGAIFLDSGYEGALQFVRKHFSPMFPESIERMSVDDAKSRLQEKLQGHINRAPTYLLDHEQGPDHAKEFTVSVRINDLVLGKGVGSSKKNAEQKAAEDALNSIDTWWEKIREE
jgi:ribonuclease-3